MRCLQFSVLLTVMCCCVTDGTCQAEAGTSGDRKYFRIRVIDKETGRGVPMVRFAVDAASIDHYADSAGVIAFDEAGLMGEDVYFRVEGFGYDLPLNEHQERALVLHVKPGGTLLLYSGVCFRDNVCIASVV